MIHLKMLLLQENGTTRKAQKGKIFTFPKTFFIWAGFGFPLLHDDDKEVKTKRRKARWSKMRRRKRGSWKGSRMKRRYKALIKMV